MRVTGTSFAASATNRPIKIMIVLYTIFLLVLFGLAILSGMAAHTFYLDAHAVPNCHGTDCAPYGHSATDINRSAEALANLMTRALTIQLIAGHLLSFPRIFKPMFNRNRQASQGNKTAVNNMIVCLICNYVAAGFMFAIIFYISLSSSGIAAP